MVFHFPDILPTFNSYAPENVEQGNPDLPSFRVRGILELPSSTYCGASMSYYYTNIALIFCFNAETTISKMLLNKQENNEIRVI